MKQSSDMPTPKFEHDSSDLWSNTLPLDNGGTPKVCVCEKYYKKTSVIILLILQNKEIMPLMPLILSHRVL